MPTPIIVPQTPITTNFSITAAQIQLTDLYGSTGIYVSTYNLSNANVVGVFKVTAPDGTVIYNNTNFSSPDVNGATPLWRLNVALPTNAGGGFVQGNYSIVYTAQINDGTHSIYQVVNNASYNFNYASPQVSITQTADCISPNFTTVDATNYAVNGVNPTVLTRTLDLNYPFGSAGAGSPLTTSSNKISTGVFYNGTQATTVSTVLSYTFPATGYYPTFTVSDTVTGAQEFVVDCALVCSIACCIQALEQRMINYQGTDQVQFQNTLAQFNLVMSYVELCFLSIDCGNSNLVNGYLTKIQNIANCTSGCDCGTGSYNQVIGLGGTAVNVVVAGGGSPIVVTSSVLSGTTTYTVSLTSAFINKVNNFYTTTITSANNTITVVETTGSGTVNYDLAVNIPAIPNRTELKSTIQFANAMVNAGSVTITNVSVVTTGTTIQAPTIAVYYSGSFSLYFNNIFLVNSFFTGTPDNAYKVLITLSDESQAYTTTEVLPIENAIKLFGRDNANGAFYFQFMELLGGVSSPTTWSQLAGKKFELTIVISE